MAVNTEKYKGIINELAENSVQLVAVSKLQSVMAIREMYDLGQRDFGENYVQELLEKQQLLPHDIHWHFIGHLQKNKAKYISQFVQLIHGVDSLDLLKEINKQGKKRNRVINCLFQVHIAQEETKFGMNETELGEAILSVRDDTNELSHICVKGLMGMASLSEDMKGVRNEMKTLKMLFDKHSYIQVANCHFTHLSMGMSSDYHLAIEEGSNMVRIGSLLFGERTAK